MNDRARLVTAAKVLAVLVGLGVLYWLPTYFKATEVNQFTRIMCIALAVVGLNLLTGFSGQISIGHGAFMGIGAYTVAILVADHEFSYWAAFAVAAGLSFVVGIVVGLPALRIRGLYLALVTLALATIFPQVIRRFSDITGGTQGKRVPRFQPPDGFSLPGAGELQRDQWWYYVALVVLAVSFLLVRNLVRSRTGRALVAIRDNETAAETMGVNLAAYKVLVFGVSAMLAGLGGALSVMPDNLVNADLFTINLSIELLVAVVVGGTGTIFGPLIGAYLLKEVPNWLEGFGRPELTPVLFGLSLILLMTVAPGGVIGLFRQAWAWVRRKRSPTVSAPAPPDPVASGP